MELSVENFATRTGMTVQAVYKKIKLNQLKTVKKSVNNRLKTFIQIEEVEEGIKLVEQHETTLRQPVEQNNPLHSQFVNTQTNEMLMLLKQMYQDNQSLSEIAGQAKLLTDSENKTKEKYFEVVQENAQLRAKLELIEEQNNKSFINWLRKL